MSDLPLCQCGCGKHVSKVTNQFCYGHRRRNHRGTPEERFWKYVNKTATCWLWTGATQAIPYNYGVLNIKGKLHRAHRLAWQFLKGPIPDGYEICHNCPDGDNPLCVNPEHLFVGTHKDNMLDCIAKGRNPAVTDLHMPTRARGSRIGTSSMNEEDVAALRQLAKAHPEIKQGTWAKQFKTSQANVSRILLYQAWKHVP